MRKKRIILKRSISALVIGAVTISILAGATSASSSVNADDATASVAVFENLLNDRSFVVDTFTQDTMPESNPYGRLDGVANTDYLSTDFLKQYENDPIFKSGVSLYYRMNHTGETISEIPSVLLDVFATDADWTKFCAGAKSKNYDSLLTSIYQNDYKSVSGNSIGSEEEGMQTLRAYSDLLDNSKTKDASKWLNDYLGAITDVNDIDKYNYLLKNTELYDENLTKYVSNVKKTLLQASKNSDGKKEMKDFSDLYEAQFYADYGAGDIPQKWDDQYKTMQIDKYGSKIKKIAKSVKTVISTGVSTVNNIVMMENLYRNQESMHDTLVRVRSNATKNNDNTFIRASSSYLSLLESDELGDNVIRSAALKSIYDYGSDELGKYVWDTAKGGVRDEAAIMVARKTGMDTLSSKMAVSAAVGRANAILAVGKDLINYGTGFDDVCEKIYLMKYLQEIKQYAVDAFNDDKNNYNKYKSQADMKNMDIWASAAIDDLQFIKRIVLLQNDLGYQTANAQIGSKYGEILSWIDGCNDAAGLEARYTNLQNALVDTTINPVSTNPISVDEGCTLQIIHSTDSDLQTYAVYTNRSGQKCSIAEFENVMLAGIRINGGTLKISDQSKEEMKFNGLFVTDKAGNLEITGNGGEIYVGRLDINGFLQINDKCSKKINVASNLNIRNYVSIKNMDIHVAGNCNVAGSLEFASSELVVDGNMEADNGYLQMQDTEDKLLVKGNLTLGETYGSSKGECLTNGTVEVKGDFTSNYKETGSNWYGYYETNMHKTIFSGEKTQKISFKEPSQVNRFSDNLELQNTDINFATPLYSLTLNQDTVLIHTDLLKINEFLNLNGHKLATTGKTECSNVAENGGTLEENPKFGHNYYNQLKPADLKDHDIKYADEAWVCTSCGKIFTDAEGIVEYDPDPCKDGHTIVIDQGKAATCTTDGLTEGKHCSVCKTVLVPQEVIPASHNWEEDFTIDKEPSCTTEGRKSIHCKKCGETKDEQVIPATGHDFTEWETIEETSCTKEGITQRRCKICGFTETKKLDKKAHEWGTEYTVDQPATFAADGSKSIHCKNCETISESIAIPRINSVKISATAYTYSGGVKTPPVTVKDANGNALHNKTDYIVQYASGRKNVGTYKVIVTLKDNYSGKKTLSFTINPKGTAISSLSKSKKAFTAKWKKQSAQTSGYQLLYSTNSKFKSRNKYVTVSSYKTTSKTIKKLAAKKKYYVKIRTYKSVSGKKYYSGWSAAKTVVTK
ncbi:putative fibronectin type III domain protein [Dorea sp. CAG:105]|nr:putative fibronectin type III domain protein [Dorea sp. CAG:105]